MTTHIGPRRLHHAPLARAVLIMSRVADQISVLPLTTDFVVTNWPSEF